MGKFDRYAFSKHPAYDEAATRKAFARAVPLKTLVIYCYDPRAVGIPDAVAKALGNEVYPGDIIVDGSGNRVASTATIFPIVVAGGRAVDALRSITVAQHLFGIQNIRRGAPFPVRRHQFHRRRHHRCLQARTSCRHRASLRTRQHLHRGLRGFAQARHRLDTGERRHAKARPHLRLLLRHRHAANSPRSFATRRTRCDAAGREGAVSGTA